MPFPFVSFKKIHGGLKVLDADLDAVRLGLLRDHYLIEVEYNLHGSTMVDQVFHKSSSAMKLFLNREDVSIIKCHCLPEVEFLTYISESNRIANKNRCAESRQTLPTAIQRESANHDEMSATAEVSNFEIPF
jgi:hypothetical protein